MAKRRRALSNVGGEAESRGDPAFAVPLARALEAASAGADAADELTHGFHSYPARMHPAVARVLLEELWVSGGVVLDPFCGSGTVAIEAMLSKWRSLGSDLDPLAIRLARVKTQRRSAKARARFSRRLQAVGRASEERVRARVDVRAQLPREEIAWYQPHILKEMAGLWEEIKAVGDQEDRAALEMVFSAIVVKFSRQASDTRAQVTEKRLRKGLVTEFFVRKGAELERRWEALDVALPAKIKRPRFVVSEAGRLPQTLGGEFQCDLVLTSPPYGGTYDYVEHHARRHAWLGIDRSALAREEIGARRQLSHGGGTAKRWDEQVNSFLAAMASLLKPDGVAILLTGDGQVGGKRVRSDTQLARLSEGHDMELLAVASQHRRDWRGGDPRREYLVAVMKK